MILPKKEDVYHKIQLYRLLTAILDSELLLKTIFFKGGTCASMMGVLDRFSVDLDFDIKKGIKFAEIDKKLRSIFKDLHLIVAKKSRATLYYILKYESPAGHRNSIKLSFITKEFKSNVYKPAFLKEIDRYAVCQTVETMFGIKLVALTDRYKKNKSIAGRDLYDIHHFFLNGYRYNQEIIKERTGKSVKSYLEELTVFIGKNINEKSITEDLSYLLPIEKFKLIKKVLKNETIMLLRDEIKKLG